MGTATRRAPSLCLSLSFILSWSKDKDVDSYREKDRGIGKGMGTRLWTRIKTITVTEVGKASATGVKSRTC